MSRAQGPTLPPPPPLTIFPEELWREIFLHCLPTNEFIRPSRTSAPLLLCQVCRAWRASAITMPDLWASISIGADFDEEDGRFPRVQLLKLWLLRAKNRPLSISYGRFPLESTPGQLPPDSEADEGGVYHIFQILFRHIARWKSLRLCPKEIVGNSLPLVPQSGAPLLQNLCLFLSPGSCEYDEYRFSSSDDYLSDIWSNSPLLTTFSMLADDMVVNRYEDSLCTTLRARWEQLTTLIITSCETVERCLEFLKECPNLVDCAFQSIFPGYEDDLLSILYATPILLASLQSFSLRDSGFMTFDFLAEFLAHTTMPALCRLTLSALEVSSPDSFAAFSYRSSCHIEDLTLCGVIISDAYLVRFLDVHSETLLRLCIRDYFPGSSRVPGPPKCISDTVMHRLTHSESTSPTGAIVCPKLESIDLDYRAVKAQDGLFSTMVSSRFGVEDDGISPLKRVILRFGDEDAIDRSQDVSASKELKEDGVIGELCIEITEDKQIHAGETSDSD